MKKLKLFIILALFLCHLLVFSPCWAVSLKKVEVDTAAEFEQGEPVSTAIVEPGQLEVGVMGKKIAELKDKPLWASLWHEKLSQIVIGTGPEGEVWGVTPDGTKKALVNLKESDVYALAVHANGDLFAGTSSKGKVYRILPDGKEDVYFDPKEEYIWDMVVDSAGALYVATGTRGRIYKVTAKDKGEIWLDLEQAHIRCLAIDNNGKLLAGTSDGGAVYRIIDKDKATTLYDAQKREIRAMKVDEKGRIYVAVNRQSTLEWRPSVFQKVASSQSGQSGSASSSDSKTDEPTLNDPPEAEAAKAAPKPTAKKQTGAGAVYLIQQNNYPQLLGEIPYTIHSLLLRKKEAGESHLWIGTGNAGFLFSVSPDRSWSQLGKVENAGQITGLVNGSNQTYVLTSNASQICQLIQASEARYFSKVIDSKLYARWGQLHVDGTGEFTIRTRSGNTASPDKSWYPWQPLKEGAIQSSQARYLQFEVSLKKGTIECVRLFYLQQNQPPRVEKIAVLETGISYSPIKPPPPPSCLPVGLEQIIQSQNKQHPPEKSQFQPEPKHEIRSVAWTSSDPNGDDLEYTVYLRPKQQAPRKLMLTSRLKEPLLSWDTSGWPEGAYDFEIEASDLPSNAKDEALSYSKVSDIFWIDRTPPFIEVLSETDQKIRVRVVDRTSLLSEVLISTDGLEYKPILPEDRLLDSKSETFEIERASTTQPLYLRVIDAAGNVSGHFFP